MLSPIFWVHSVIGKMLDSGFETGQVHVLGIELDVECLIGLKGRADAPVRQVVGRSIGGCAFVSREHLVHPVGNQSIAVDGRSAMVSSAVSRKVTESLDLVRDGLLHKNGRPPFSTKARGQKLPRTQHPWL
jgi:hypothetical protein